ncbi:MAG: hypothetical protein NTU97_02405, partial [Candidatus Magasanikbacteria bacterium]|nr:hypothetical protein [Candidatus Magasanikbacteria bacterium]
IFALDMILVGIAVLLAAVSAVLFFSPLSKNYLTITLSDNTTATIGQTKDLKITLINNTNFNLTDINAIVEFPKNIFLKEYPENFDPKTSSVNLGSLGEKGSLTILFKGQVWGSLNEKQKIVVKTTFVNPKKQTQNQIDSLELPLTQSVLKVDWQIPDQVKVGQNFNLVVNYKNDSSETLAQVVLVPTLPADFTILSSTLDLINGQWVLKNVPGNFAGKIEMTGFLNSLSLSSNLLTLTLQSFLEFDQKQYLQSSLIKNLEGQSNGLNLQFSVADKKTFFKPGEEITLNLHYQNTTDKEIKDLSFALPLPPFLTSDKQTQINSEKIILAPKAEGAATLKFTITKNLQPGEDLAKNFSLVLRPTASFYFADQPTILNRTLTRPEQFKISTFLKLHAESRYFTEEGDQLGRGPLPPKVGQATKYWINFFLTTSPNAVKDITYKAHLPEGIVWTGRTNVIEGEPLKFDPITRTITWKTDLVEATAGDTCPCVGAGFEVSLTPAPETIGKTPKLLEQISLGGTDIYTNEFIETTSSDLTTDLINDSYAKNKSKVQE